MRVLALWFLVALLPLRLWAGDAMALSMIAPPAAGPTADDLAVAACAVHGAAAQEAVAHERHGGPHGSADAQPADPFDWAVSHDASDGHAHTLCDVCNGPVIAALELPLPLGMATHGAIDRPAARFASAPLARGLKPPIA